MFAFFSFSKSFKDDQRCLKHKYDVLLIYVYEYRSIETFKINKNKYVYISELYF